MWHLCDAKFPATLIKSTTSTDHTKSTPEHLSLTWVSIFLPLQQNFMNVWPAHDSISPTYIRREDAVVIEHTKAFKTQILQVAFNFLYKSIKIIRVQSWVTVSKTTTTKQQETSDTPKTKNRCTLDKQTCYRDSVDNTVEENSSVFSLIRMQWLLSERASGQ